MHPKLKNLTLALPLVTSVMLFNGCGPLPPATESSSPDAGESATDDSSAAAADSSSAEPNPGGAGTFPPVAAADPIKRLYGWGYAKLPNEPVTGLRQVVASISGFTVALQSDGSVVVWGATFNGEHFSPEGNDFTAVAAGLIHALALRADGTVVGWGANFSGESNPPSGTFTAIAAGQSFSLGLRTDGSISHWGSGDAGLVTPPDGTDFTAISAGRLHGLALKSDGSIVSWGATFSGLDNVPTGQGFKAIAAGGYFSVALRADGSIVAWGDNTEGQATPPAGTGYTAISAGEAHGLALTADGTIVRWGRKHADEDPPAGSGFKQIEGGGYHSVAITADDTFAGWGSDHYGESSLRPNTGYTAVAVGGEHFLAVLQDGSLHGWGWEDYGGYGEATPPAGNNYTAVAAGSGHSLALRTDGSIFGWGRDDAGQATPPSGTGFTAIAARSRYSLALTQDRSIVAWGDNFAGITTPPAGTGYVAISAGSSHALALKQDGSIVGWGQNDSGQAVGREETGYRAIAAGNQFSLAIRADGSIEGWGDNTDGKATPPAGTNYTAVGAGDSFGIALTTTGEIVVWGYNQQGRMTPPNLSGFTDIAAGAEIVLALRAGDPPAVAPFIKSPTMGVLSAGNLTVTVGITGDAAQVERINLYFDGELAGSRTAAPFEFQIEAVAAGPHKVTAEAVLTGEAGTTRSSRTYLYRLVGPPTFIDLVTLLEFIVGQDAGSPLDQPIPLAAGALARRTPGRSIAADVATFDRDVLERFMVEVVTPLLDTASGAFYNDLGQGMALPLLEGVLQDPARAEPLLGTLIDWTPVLSALSDEQGSEVPITTGLAAGIHQIFATAIAAADPAFAQYLESEIAALDPDTWSGLTADGLIARVSSQVRPAPSIATQPVTQKTTAGGSAILTVEATGAGPIAYQWFKDGVAIPGATGATYNVPSVQSFHAGDYSVTVSNPFDQTQSDMAPFSVDPAPPANAGLANLSTRAVTQTGTGVLIPGFVVSGSGSKQLLMRVIGPTLGGFGVPNTVADPRMTLKRSDGNSVVDVAANDNWSGDAITQTAASLGAFELGTGSADAALLETLSAGRYTIVAEGVGNTSGVVLVEFYDADVADQTTALANISARTFVGPGGQAPIPGFVISGDGPRTVLVRAVGPALADFGVQGTLPDPQFTIFDGDLALFGNDNWETGADANQTVATAEQVGAFPLAAGSKDAAMVVTLAPGRYTVVVSDLDGATGIALVEAYLVP